MPALPTLRAAEERDIDAITEIYAEAVRDGRASFELEPPDTAEMHARWRKVIDAGYPYIVGTFDGEVGGYAYTGPYHNRPAYRWTAEDSIYVDPRFQGRGMGLALLTELMKQSEAAGIRQVVAVIGDSANLASVRLHARLGFRPVGTLVNVGFKHGRWLDTVIMQKSLGEAATTPPM